MNQYPQRPTTYKGRLGSTADLTMCHLEVNGPTGEIALAAAIDKEAHELGALLQWPIKQGALKKEVVGDEWVYSMGDGVPLEAAAERAAAELPPPVISRKVSERESLSAGARETPDRAATKAIAKARKRDPEVTKPSRESTKPDTPAPVPPAGETFDPIDETAAEFRIALWSDGVLDIRRPGGHLLRFTKAEARAIVSYLDAISTDPLREGAPAL